MAAKLVQDNGKVCNYDRSVLNWQIIKFMYNILTVRINYVVFTKWCFRNWWFIWHQIILATLCQAAPPNFVLFTLTILHLSFCCKWQRHVVLSWLWSHFLSNKEYILNVHCKKIKTFYVFIFKVFLVGQQNYFILI